MTRAEDAPGRSALLWWVLAFAVHRALLVALGFDGVFFWEETYRLLIADALRGGWHIPLHDLQADPYAGGSLVFAALTALAAGIGGLSIVTLKIVALAWNALGLWLWLVVTDRVFGRRAAHALGLVWLAAPPVFMVFNVVGQGFHSDTVTLAGLQWLLLYRFIERPADRARLFAWTAAAGLSIWFSYASALTFVAGAAYALAAGALPVRSLPVAAAGFLAGFSPWIVRSVVSGGGLAIVGETFARGSAEKAGYLARLVDVTIHGVPVALYFRDIGVPGDVKVPRALLSYPYLAVCAFAWIAATVAAIKRIASRIASRSAGAAAALSENVRLSPELPILLVFPLFVATIAASNQEFNDYGMVRWFTFRIIVPALPSLFFAVALAAARAPRIARIAALSVCALAGAIGTGEIVSDGSEHRALAESEARETGAEAYGHLVVFKHGTEPIFGPRIDALPQELRERAYRGVGFSFAYLFGTRRSDAAASGLTKALLSVDPAHRAAAIEGARRALAEGLAQVPPLTPSPRRDELKAAIDQAEAGPLDAPTDDSRAALRSGRFRSDIAEAPRRDRSARCEA